MSCKDKDGHPHPMEKLGFDLDDGSSPADAKQTNPQVTYQFILKIFEFCNYNKPLMRSYLLRFSNAGGQEVIDTEMHSVIGACLPVQRCQLSPTKLSEDEASGDAYEKLQEKDEWWLSYM